MEGRLSVCVVVESGRNGTNDCLGALLQFDWLGVDVREELGGVPLIKCLSYYRQ